MSGVLQTMPSTSPCFCWSVSVILFWFAGEPAMICAVNLNTETLQLLWVIVWFHIAMIG